jgi:hypothetical protein
MYTSLRKKINNVKLVFYLTQHLNEGKERYLFNEMLSRIDQYFGKFCVFEQSTPSHYVAVVTLLTSSDTFSVLYSRTCAPFTTKRPSYVIHVEQQERKRGWKTLTGKFARVTSRSATDICQNVSSTKHFIAKLQTNKSTLIPTGGDFNLCRESSSVLGWKMLFEPAGVGCPPLYKKIVCNTLVGI